MKYYYPLAILMVLHATFLPLGVYSTPHLDSVMHLLGGVALGMSVLGVLTLAIRKTWCPDPGKTVELVLIVSLVASGAVCWELYEWLSDWAFGTNLQLTVTDTVKDMFLGLLGGVLFAGYVFVTRPALELVNTATGAGSPVQPEASGNQ